MSDTISIYKGDNHRECDIDEAKNHLLSICKLKTLIF